MDYKLIIETLDEMLPPLFRRAEIATLTNGLFTANTLKTLPKNVPHPKGTQLGKYLIYRKQDFLNWVEEYYGNFVEYSDAGFDGKKLRRNTGAARKA